LPLKEQPLNYLEVGVFEGRSVLWMIENVLTHPDSRLTGVDIFQGKLRDRYLANLELSGFAERATTIQGHSQQELRKLAVSSFDIVYIDGSHTADDVLADAVLSWQLLKPNGLLIFDDYDWSGYPGPKEPRTPDELRPQAAVDSFITAHRNTIEIVHRGYQLFARKVTNPCAYKEGCSPIGRYQYRWWERRLIAIGGAEPVDLSEGQLDVLEQLLRSRAPGRVRFEPSAELREKPELNQVEQKLGLRL
jgi:predicted O-methyltransferase YrrM